MAPMHPRFGPSPSKVAEYLFGATRAGDARASREAVADVRARGRVRAQELRARTELGYAPGAVADLNEKDAA